MTTRSKLSSSLLRLNKIELQVIIYSTEDPVKVYPAIDALLPEDEQIFTPQPDKKRKRSPTVSKLKIKSHYRNELQFITITFSQQKQIKKILQYWADLLPIDEKQNLQDLVKQQFRVDIDLAKPTVYLRINRFFAQTKQIRFLESQSVVGSSVLMESGATFQVQLQFQRPYKLPKDIVNINQYYLELVSTFLKHWRLYP